MTSSIINGVKEAQNIENSLTNTKLVSSSSSNTLKNSKNTMSGSGGTKNAPNRLSRASQNEVITLPPIVEAQVSSTSNGFNGFHKKSNSSTNRIDSGIANTDSEILQTTNGWTLSPNGSDNDDSNSKFNGNKFENF